MGGSAFLSSLSFSIILANLLSWILRKQFGVALFYEDGFLFFLHPPHRRVSNLPHLTLAKHEVRVEQVCCQVRWGVWARGSVAAEVFPGFLCGRKTRAFPTIWFRLAVDPSLSQAFIWFGGTKWVSGVKVWFQVDSSLAAGTWSGIVAAWRSQLLDPPPLPSVSTLGRPQHKVNAYSYRNGDLFKSSQEKLFIRRILLNWNQTGRVDDIKATLEISYFLLFLSLCLPLSAYLHSSFYIVIFCFSISSACHAYHTFLSNLSQLLLYKTIFHPLHWGIQHILIGSSDSYVLRSLGVSINRLRKLLGLFWWIPFR